MGKSVVNYLILILLALIWGSSFILMKRGLVFFNFSEVASLRIVIAFFSLIPFLPKALKTVKYKHYFPILITALIGNGIPAFLFAKAQTQLDSSLVGTLNSSVPLFTLILGIYFFGSRPSKLNIMGILVGFLGTLFLTFNNFKAVDSFNIYSLLVILATICYATSINVIKKYLYDLNASSITALSFLVLGPFAAIYLINNNLLIVLNSTTEGYTALAYIALLAVLGTSLATIIFNILLSRTSAIFVSSITYLIPIVAIFWGFIDGEIITIHHFFGFFIVLSGVYLVNKK